MSFVKRFERNTVGRDFAVGDVHGHFTRLESAMRNVGFDESRDRLFSVGDLVDRGPESHRAVEFVNKPWFHAVQGNHDDGAIRYTTIGKRDVEHYVENGGAWLVGMQRYEQVEIADTLSTLPYAIEVDTPDGVVGITHAGLATETWGEMLRQLDCADTQKKLKAALHGVMWCRLRFLSEDRTGIPDMRAVIVGHTPVKRPVVLGNVYHIDTGGWMRDGYFTLINLATLETIPPLPQKLEWAV